MTSDHNRGKVFGQMQSAFMSGMFCTTMVAGNMANLYIARLPGWRIVIFLASLVVYVVTGIVWKYMIEPPRSDEELDHNRSILGEIWTVLRFLRIPTFSIMIMQGIFGGMPWTIMGNLAGARVHVHVTVYNMRFNMYIIETFCQCHLKQSWWAEEQLAVFQALWSSRLASFDPDLGVYCDPSESLLRP